jgi:hypothetical protein
MEDKNEVKQQFVELRAKGNSYDRIASKLSVSKGTLISWSREMFVDINNYLSMETDAILEKHKMAKKNQLELFGMQLNKIRKELEKRDLSDISTDKLLNMELKLIGVLNDVGVVQFTETGFFLDEPERQWKA